MTPPPTHWVCPAWARVSCAAASCAANRPAARIVIRHARWLMSRHATGRRRCCSVAIPASDVFPESVILCLLLFLDRVERPRVRSLSGTCRHRLEIPISSVNRVVGTRPTRFLHIPDHVHRVSRHADLVRLAGVRRRDRALSTWAGADESGSVSGAPWSSARAYAAALADLSYAAARSAAPRRGPWSCPGPRLTSSPTTRMHRTNRGIALSRLGRGEEAMESLDRALSLDPHEQRARDARERILHE